MLFSIMLLNCQLVMYHMALIDRIPEAVGNASSPITSIAKTSPSIVASSQAHPASPPPNTPSIPASPSCKPNASWIIIQSNFNRELWIFLVFFLSHKANRARPAGILNYSRCARVTVNHGWLLRPITFPDTLCNVPTKLYNDRISNKNACKLSKFFYVFV